MPFHIRINAPKIRLIKHAELKLLLPFPTTILGRTSRDIQIKRPLQHRRIANTPYRRELEEQQRLLESK